MRTSCLSLVLLPALLLAGCGDPRDKILPFDLAASPDAKETLAKLSPSEQQAISEYEIRRAARLAEGDVLAHKSVTYREAIADQLVYDTAQAQRLATARIVEQAKQQEMNAKAAAVAAIDAANLKLMRETITCNLMDKRFDSIPKIDAPSLPLPQVTYSFNCRNAGTAAVNGFKGSLVVTGPYGETISIIPLRRDNPLASGNSFQIRYKKSYVSIGNDLTASTLYDLSVDKIATKVDLDFLLKADGELIRAKPF